MKGVAVKEWPIIMSGESVRAILDGRKTQARRVVKPQPPAGYDRVHAEPPGYGWQWENDSPPFPRDELGMWTKRCPYGLIGDRLWVRETWAWLSWCYQGSHAFVPPAQPTYPPHYGESPRYAVEHRAGTERRAWGMHGEPRWRSPILMPRTASRITLEITDVRVERLQEIGPEDVTAEGLPYRQSTNESPIGSTPANYRWFWGFPTPSWDGGVDYVYSSNHREAYRELWDSINGKRHPWSSNPFVWCISFRMLP